MPRPKLGVNSRGLGLELARHRKIAELSLAEVGERLGTSASTISRLENGKRELSTEEVAAYLAIVRVTGAERERLMEMARSASGSSSGMVENSNPTVQSRTYQHFETRATVITDFELLLVPGLAQTAEYAHAVVSAIQVDEGDDDIGARVGRRMARQAILFKKHAPRLNLILTENGLRQALGGPKVMARQIRSLIDIGERDKVSVRVIPAATPAHAGLTGAFVLMEFASDPTVVFVEARTTGLFRDDPDEVALYRLTLEKLTDAALDGPASVELMRSIARDFDGE